MGRDSGMFVIQKERLAGKTRRGVLALGTDVIPRLSWVQDKTLFSVACDPSVTDTEEFYRGALSLIHRRMPGVHCLAFDPHPFFVSSQKVSDFRHSFFSKSRLVPVYHHWAHAANGFWDIPRVEKYLAVVFDGTGYGCDGQIWGGEFFLCSSGGFQRLAHLAYQPLVGGDKGVLEPWRMAYLILKEKREALAEEFFKSIPAQKRRIIAHMRRTGLQTIQTSSAGRLFDAASGILGLKHIVREQAEAAQSLQKAAERSRGTEGYVFPLKKKKEEPWVIETTPVLCRMAEDRKISPDAAASARKFHLGLAQGIFKTASVLAQKHRIRDIYISGGVFCNSLLTQAVKEYFYRGPCVLHKGSVSTDEGISRGQAAYCTFVSGAGSRE